MGQLYRWLRNYQLKSAREWLLIDPEWRWWFCHDFNLLFRKWSQHQKKTILRLLAGNARFFTQDDRQRVAARKSLWKGERNVSHSGYPLLLLMLINSINYPPTTGDKSNRRVLPNIRWDDGWWSQREVIHRWWITRGRKGGLVFYYLSKCCSGYLTRN